VREEQAAGQFEFRCEELLRGIVVDDRYGSQGRIAPLRAPFAAEHLDEGSVDALQVQRHVEDAMHALAAGAVGARRRGVKERTARVGVDLDQARSAAAQMKVVAHEGAHGTMIRKRNGRRVLQDRGAIAGQGGRAIQGRNAVRQDGEVVAADEHRRRREEVWAFAGQLLRHPRRAGQGGEFPGQQLRAQRAAHAFEIERFREVHAAAFSKGRIAREVRPPRSLRPGSSAR
jgi:hypothetical protein